MIITNLIGGLGNQMFQYACGRALSIRNSVPLLLAADQFSNYQQHNGLELLNIFNINVPLATPRELASLLGFKANPRVRRLLGRPSMSCLTGKFWCNEPHFDYWARVHDIDFPKYIHGYWQSESYFADVAEIIRDDFTFRYKLDGLDLDVYERMSRGPCVSLHVRRGDYLKGKFKNIYTPCNVEYYISAVQLIRKKHPHIKIFAFSDEPDWVVRNLEPEIGSMEVVCHNIGSSSANDMRLMSLADHHIIANSSFSWWGAWLNPSKEKEVIAPKVWFADGRQTPTLLPTSWIRI